MMTEIEVNDYISAAREALNDDPDYNRWFNALVEEFLLQFRKENDFH